MSDKEKEGGGAMETMADTVGFVPNVKAKDNLIQAGVVGGGTLIASAAAYVVTGNTESTLLVALGALIGLTILSGAVLMVVGLIRTAKKVTK